MYLSVMLVTGSGTHTVRFYFTSVSCDRTQGRRFSICFHRENRDKRLVMWDRGRGRGFQVSKHLHNCESFQIHTSINSSAVFIWGKRRLIFECTENVKSCEGQQICIHLNLLLFFRWCYKIFLLPDLTRHMLSPQI